MSMNRKSIFLWNIPAFYLRQDFQDRYSYYRFIANMIFEGGFNEVWVKVADYNRVFYPSRNVWPEWGENCSPEFVEVLQSAGIKVFGWGFCYGYKVEADIAIAQVKRLGLDGYIYDVEGAFEDNYNAAALANHLGFTFKQKLPDTPLGFCSWALYKSPVTGGRWHNDMVARVFMDYCDFASPMIYWDGTTPSNVLWWINNSYAQHKDITNKPLVAVGRAYTGDSNGLPTEENVKTFAQRADTLGYAGLSWWVLDQAYYKKETWKALTEINTGIIIPPDPEPDKDLYAKALYGHINIRSKPIPSNSTERGGTVQDDLFRVVGDRVVHGDVVYIPVELFIAESEGNIQFSEIIEK